MGQRHAQGVLATIVVDTVVRIGEHWEPPQARPLLISVHALADRLDVPLDRAYGLSYSIGRLYFGESHTHVRVLAASVEAVAELLESGMSLGQAAEAMHARSNNPPQRLAGQAQIDFSWGRRRRRRWTS